MRNLVTGFGHQPTQDHLLKAVQGNNGRGAHVHSASRQMPDQLSVGRRALRRRPSVTRAAILAVLIIHKRTSLRVSGVGLRFSIGDPCRLNKKSAGSAKPRPSWAAGQTAPSSIGTQSSSPRISAAQSSACCNCCCSITSPRLRTCRSGRT